MEASAGQHHEAEPHKQPVPVPPPIHHQEVAAHEPAGQVSAPLDTKGPSLLEELEARKGR